MNERSSFLCFSLFYLIRDLLTLHFHSFLSRSVDCNHSDIFIFIQLQKGYD